MRHWVFLGEFDTSFQSMINLAFNSNISLYKDLELKHVWSTKLCWYKKLCCFYLTKWLIITKLVIKKIRCWWTKYLRNMFPPSILYNTSVYWTGIRRTISFMLGSFFYTILLLLTYALSDPCTQTTRFIAFAPLWP